MNSGLRTFSLESRIAKFIVKFSFQGICGDNNIEITSLILKHSHFLVKKFLSLYPKCENKEILPSLSYTALVLSIISYNECTYEYNTESYANIFKNIHYINLEGFDLEALSKEAALLYISAKQLNRMILVFFKALDWNLEITTSLDKKSFDLNLFYTACFSCFNPIQELDHL